MGLTLFYWERGYREVVVDPDTVFEGGRAVVVFNIEEGEPVRLASFEIVGAEEVLPPNALRNLPLRVGEPFNLLAVEAARDTLINRLVNRGYARAEVLRSADIRTDSVREASIVYEVYPGTQARFGEIEVHGAEKVSPTVIRRMLTFAPGDLYRRNELLRSQRNLFGLDIPAPRPDHRGAGPRAGQHRAGRRPGERRGHASGPRRRGHQHGGLRQRRGALDQSQLLRGRAPARGARQRGQRLRRAAGRRSRCWDTGDSTYGKIAGSLARGLRPALVFRPPQHVQQRGLRRAPQPARGLRADRARRLRQHQPATGLALDPHPRATVPS